MKTDSPYDRGDIHINKNDKVLEIGPGHNPTYRSNVIVEKFIDTNYHRCGDVKIYPHQTFVHADGEKLPFKDKEFDYVICNQVLEHVEHPEAFVKELCRVARRGYIETPSLLGEYLFPKKSHKWVILDIDNKLVFYEKNKMPGNYENDYGELFLNYLPFQSLPYKLLWLTEGDITLNRYEWKDEVEMLGQVKDQIDPRVYNMVLSGIEGPLLTNLMTYPYASSSYHKKKLEDCMATDYWTALDGYKLRDDEASLRSRAYQCMLAPYKDYVRAKEAHDAGKEYEPLSSLEEQYEDFVAFYDGNLRDTALFVFLYDSIAAGKDFNVIEKLVKDYLKKYNKVREYKRILNQIMQ